MEEGGRSGRRGKETTTGGGWYIKGEGVNNSTWFGFSSVLVDTTEFNINVDGDLADVYDILNEALETSRVFSFEIYI